MQPRESTIEVVPKLDVSVAGVYMPRGEAIPLIVQLENARELRRSGILAELTRSGDRQSPRKKA